MDNTSGFPDPTATSVKPLRNTFLFDLEGNFVVAIKLSSKIAKQISGQDMESSGDIISKLKVKLGFAAGVERWFIVTSVDNPLLEEIAKFRSLVADELAKATGTAITESELAISASIPITGLRDESFNSVREDQEQSAGQPFTSHTSLL